MFTSSYLWNDSWFETFHCLNLVSLYCLAIRLLKEAFFYCIVLSRQVQHSKVAFPDMKLRRTFFIVLVISLSLKNGSGWGRSMLREGFHLCFKATNSPGRWQQHFLLELVGFRFWATAPRGGNRCLVLLIFDASLCLIVACFFSQGHQEKNARRRQEASRHTDGIHFSSRIFQRLSKKSKFFMIPPLRYQYERSRGFCGHLSEHLAWKMKASSALRDVYHCVTECSRRNCSIWYSYLKPLSCFILFCLFVCYVFINFSKFFMNMLSIDTGLLLWLTFFLLNILVKTIFRVCRPSGEVNDNIICLHSLYLSRYY